MSEEDEVDFTPKLNCGVWTAIENFINKENNEMIWDYKNVPAKASVTRKKEKFRASKKITQPTLATLVSQRRSASSRRGSDSGSGSITGRVSSIQNAFASAGACTVATTFAHKALNLRKTRNEHAEEVFERSRQMLESCNIATIDCSFNLPRVNAQLERLMGSNVVHLTDRKYMVELRRRITEDFESMLMKRINQRKQEEVERQMKLLLHGLYSVRNVPPKLISAHSIVLAEEIQRQRVLLMDGKLLKCPKELRSHPVLVINETTNKFVIKRRAKLKTERERVSERIIRLGKKWEVEHSIWEDRERQREAELKIKEIKMLSADKSYFSQLESIDGRTDLEKNYLPNELNLAEFLRKERKLMHARLEPKEKIFEPFKKDIRVVDAKRRMSEASVQKLKLLVAKIKASNTIDSDSSLKLVKEDEQKNDTQDAQETKEVTERQESTEASSSDSVKKKKGKILFGLFGKRSKGKKTQSEDEKTDSSRPQTPQTPMKQLSFPSSQGDDSIKVVVKIDPVVHELKRAQNVTELYRIAEKIVGSNIENILSKEKSDEGDE